MKTYELIMAEKDIVWIDQSGIYFKPDIKFDINSMSFIPNTEGVLLKGKEFCKGLYSVQLVKLGNALHPKCNTVSERIDLDCFETL